MGKTVAVLQSNYIPWKGYFDIIHDVDVFVFYDDVQYTRQDWRNRNLIKTPKGAEWLSVPVGTRIDRLICDVRIEDPAWAARHWGAIQTHYRKAPHFKAYKPLLEDVYVNSKWESLSELNQALVKRIARECLGIETTFEDSRQYGAAGERLERLLDLLRKVGADTYVSGPAAKEYIDPVRFEEAGIKLVWKDYGGYPEYPQFHPPFVHGVTVLDLLFQAGPDAPRYIWGWRDGA